MDHNETNKQWRRAWQLRETAAASNLNDPWHQMSRQQKERAIDEQSLPGAEPPSVVSRKDA